MSIWMRQSEPGSAGLAVRLRSAATPERSASRWMMPKLNSSFSSQSEKAAKTGPESWTAGG